MYFIDKISLKKKAVWGSIFVKQFLICPWTSGQAGEAGQGRRLGLAPTAQNART